MELDHESNKTGVESTRTSDKIQVKNIKEMLTAATVVNTLCHILITLLVIYIVFKSFEVYTLYSWHPSLMAIGFLALMSEAILAFSDVNITRTISYRNQVFIHWLLQLLAVVCIVLGYTSIYVHKIQHNKKHLHSNHSIFGLVTTLLVVVTSIGGAFTKYSYLLRDYVSPVYLKIVHALLGNVTFLLNMVTMVLGFYTHWYHKNTSPTIQFCSAALVILMTMYVLYKPVKLMYSRIENICQRSVVQ